MSGIQQLMGGKPAAATGYQIQRSLRFNSADDAHLNRTPASAGNRKTWTWSGWVKRSSFGFQALETVKDGGSEDSIAFLSGNTIRVYMSPVAGNGTVTDAVFRDSGAWYHIVVAVDTTQATAANRTIIYVNNVNVTSSSSNYITQNSDTKFNGTFVHYIGLYANQVQPSGNFDGYMTEINFIDGQQLTPSSFGQTNSATGVWEPIAYTGTYGTNGFYLNFSDNSGTTSTTLGKDYSGNGNNWTPNNFSVTAGAGNDSLVDTPTPYGTDTGAGGEVRGNYATFNPLGVYQNLPSNATYSDGNLKVDYKDSTVQLGSTLRVPNTSGKYYCEFTATFTSPSNGFFGFTVQGGSASATAVLQQNGALNVYGVATLVSSTGSGYSSGDICSLIIDIDAKTVEFKANNVSRGVASFSAVSGGYVDPFVWLRLSGDSWVANFGQRPFAYTAPSGYKALCTQNLPTPTIGATSTTQAGKYFNPVLYTGDGSNPRGITGVGFQPDFVWLKNRSAGWGHRLSNAVVGANYALESNNTNAELYQNQYGYLTSFNSDGFTVTAGSTDDYYTNNSGEAYVAWNWKANGAGSSNTSGTITSTVSANTTAGFSIVTYTGNGTTGATVGHGLGVKPSMMIFKGRTNSVDWVVYHTSLGATKNLKLNLTDAEATQSGQFNDTEPTSTLFTLGANSPVNANTITYVAYCFAAVAGYSAFGSYTGNGSSDGPFIYTGFRPAYLLVKRTDSATGANWYIFDYVRSPYNAVDCTIAANLSNAESTGGYNAFDLLSNGFKLRSTDVSWNANASTYIYAAFAQNPFKYSLAR